MSWGLTHVGGTAGDRGRRAPTAAAAGGTTPASWQLGPINKRTGKLLGTLGQVGARRVGGASDRRVEFTVSTNGGNGGSVVRRSVARRTVRRLYRQAPRRLSVFLHTKARTRQYKRGVGGDAAATRAGAGRYGGAATGRAARHGHAVRAYWATRAVAWRFSERRTDRRTKDWPRRADLADHGAAVATPARAHALWSARVPTPLGLALSDQQQSCRSPNPLPLSPRASSLFLNNFCTNWMPRCRISRL
jgi:hypothetical protein